MLCDTLKMVRDKMLVLLTIPIFVNCLTFDLDRRFGWSSISDRCLFVCCLFLFTFLKF